MSQLVGKTLVVIGANGYVGSHVAQYALQQGAKLISVSRSGAPPKSHENWTTKVDWVKGDCMQPEGFEDQLISADAVVHTVGTLIDTSLTKFRKPGEEGTYEHMIKDTAVNVSNKLNEISGKKIVFLSASKSLPLVPRYMENKIAAEDHIKGLENLKYTFLRPGVIYTPEVAWRYALKFPTNLYAGIFSFVNKQTDPAGKMRKLLSNVDVDYAVDMKSVAISALVTAFDSTFDGRTLFNEDMETIKTRYLEKGYKFPN